jgi:hypothetical protein
MVGHELAALISDCFDCVHRLEDLLLNDVAIALLRLAVKSDLLLELGLRYHAGIFHLIQDVALQLLDVNDLVTKQI